jgi:hypothetical protein
MIMVLSGFLDHPSLSSLMTGSSRASRWLRRLRPDATIRTYLPILPFSWRTFVYSGGDVCHVEIGYMNKNN